MVVVVMGGERHVNGCGCMGGEGGYVDVWMEKEDT